MNLKKNTKQKVIIAILTLVWGMYYFQAYQFYSEVKEFITPGTSYMIKILEFTNYRSEQLSIILIEFFALFSISSVLYWYVYNTLRYTNNRRKVISYIISINVVYLLISFLVSNIFWTVHLLLAVLVLMILAASVYISNLLFDSTVSFQKGDIVYYSEGYETESQAKKDLENKLRKIDKKNSSKVSGEVFNVNTEYFFEIYANDQLILDNKGEFIVHEKAK